MTVKEAYENKEMIGFLPLFGDCALVVLDIQYGIDDYAVTCFSGNGQRSSYGRNKIYYGKRPYIIKNGIRYHMDDIMRYSK